MRARELRIEAHVERCVEIGGCVAGQAWAHAAKQAIQLGASKGGAGGRGLECTLGEVIDGEVGGTEDCKHLRCHVRTWLPPADVAGIDGLLQKRNHRGQEEKLVNSS